MNDIIDFFVAPYATATALGIVFEVLAVLLGILSVWYAKKENILVFPTGIISTVLYVYICFKFALYGDVIINVYYTLMSVYGWFMWHRKIEGNSIGITQSTIKDMMWALIIFVTT